MDQLPFKVQRIFSGLFAPSKDNSSIPTDSGMSTGGGPDDMQYKPPEFQDQSQNPDDMIKGLLTGQNTAMDKLNQLLATQPIHDDYKPGFGRKLLGGLISINDPKAGQAFTDKKFNEAQSEWEAKLKPIQDIATAEKGINANNRLAGIGMLRDQQAAKRDETTRRGQDLRDAQNRANLDEKYYFTDQKYNRPNTEKFMDENGDLYNRDKATGQVTPMINPETGLHMKGDKLPQREQMNLKQNYDLAKIDATTAGRNSNIITKGNTDVLTSARTLPDKITLKSTTPGKNTSAIQPTPKDGDTKVAVLHPDGTPGFIPKKQLEAALAQGYKLANTPPVKTTGVGLNLKPVQSKVGF